eukprot:m51a1_g8927 hypothetical protein (1229) ;mRNA; r:839870-844450
MPRLHTVVAALLVAAALCSYVSAKVWSDTDFLWREEAAVNGSSDPQHVSLRVSDLPDDYLCAADTSSLNLVIRKPAAMASSLCTFRKVTGLSDVGLVSFVNEARYLAVASTLTGHCGTWLATSGALDVVLNAFPTTKESATWAPVDASWVTIRVGGFYDARGIFMHNCGGALYASSTSQTPYDWTWIIDKARPCPAIGSSTNALAISIRPAVQMDLYLCFDGVRARLLNPKGIEDNCTFLALEDTKKRVLGGNALYHPQTDMYLVMQDNNTAEKLDPCVTTAVGHYIGGVSAKQNLSLVETMWSFSRAASVVTKNISATPSPYRSIGNQLLGITLDDANFGSDGGLYAQLIRNRDFEAQGRGNLGDGVNVSDTAVATDMRPWTVATTQGTATVGLTTATHPFDTNPVALSVAATAAATVQLTNPGYWGIAVVKGTTYKGSVRAKSSCTWTASAVLRDSSDNAASSQWTQSLSASDAWAKVEFTLTGQKTSTSANFVFGVEVTGSCTVWLDSFSLIPADAVLGLFRKDLYTALAALRPSFVQFPWGKTLEGTSADTRWSFGGTVGEADARPGHYSSAWGSWSTDGLGLHEFLLLAESLAAHPILSLFAGRVGGDTGNYPSSFDPATVAQEAVNVLQYANGAATTTYGAMRKSNGHALPFDVREVQIGSGYDSSMADYARFFNPTLKAIAAAFPNITITASSAINAQNPCLSNRTLCMTWNDRLQSSLTQVARKYDSYDRTLPLLSVTASQPADLASVTAATAEAAFLIGVERNADAVAHYSLVPPLRNNNGADMSVGLVAFDSAEAQMLPSYHVHRMFAETPCTHTLATTVPSGLNAHACRTFEGDVVFRVANWAAEPLVATLSVAGISTAPTLINVTVLSGLSAGSYDPAEVLPVSRTTPDVASKVTVVVPWCAFAVVVFRRLLPMDNATVSSSSYADPCADHSMCRSCLIDAKCGWCESSGVCMTINISGTTPAACHKDWRFNTCAPSSGSGGTNVAAIVGGAVGGGGFALIVVAVAVSVIVTRSKGHDRPAAPNIPIDNLSVGFVATSTAMDPALGLSTATEAPLTIFPTNPFDASPAGGTSNSSGGGSANTPPRVDMGVLNSVGTSIQISTDLMAVSLGPIYPIYPYGIVPVAASAFRTAEGAGLSTGSSSTPTRVELGVLTPLHGSADFMASGLPVLSLSAPLAYSGVVPPPPELAPPSASSTMAVVASAGSSGGLSACAKTSN